VLRDTADKPAIGGSFEPLQPGERRVVWAMFPSPSAETRQVTLQVGGVVLRDVPLAELSQQAPRM
jgi:hypothetical protein